MMDWKHLLSPHRLGSESTGKISQDRSPFQRDFDRIVFSGSFRKLQDKTQVFPLSKNGIVHTRLTHSLETSSIARSLGTACGVFVCKEFDTNEAQPSDIGAAVAAAALAHDIGNPPLGHAGEEAIRHWFTHSPIGRALKEQMSAEESADIEYYEGNAQGFRVLSALEMSDRYGGMQLTCATLGAFAKYPRAAKVETRPFGVAGKKFNFFQSEKRQFTEVAESCGMMPAGPWAWQRHPLAFLVEAADDIAYRIVDFEDGQQAGIIDYQELEMLFLQIINEEKIARGCSEIKSEKRRAEYLRAHAIGKLVQAAAKVFIDKQDELLNGNLANPLIDYLDCREALKRIEDRSRDSIYNHIDVAEIVGSGFELVSGMLDIFVPCVNEMADEFNGKGNASFRSKRLFRILPDIMEESTGQEWLASPYYRLLRLLDYISGMTDSHAVRLYQKLKGISL